MRILMKKTEKGSPNGIIVTTYEKGQEYDVPERLYNIFKKLGIAEDVKPKMETTPVNKMASTPENKSMKVDSEDVMKRQDDDLDDNLSTEEDGKSSKRQRRK